MSLQSVAPFFVLTYSSLKSKMTAQSALVLSVLISYFLILLIVSRFTSKREENNDGFFMAHHNAPWWVVSIGMIGASVSGVSFLSVPGMVKGIGFQYMQTVFGFLLGYIVIAQVLLPIYYRLPSASIYEYLQQRFGRHAYKTGASYFLISKLFSTAAKVYVIVVVLQAITFDAVGIPFYISAALIIAMIWLYTRRGGLRTIVWTDLLQTIFMIVALILIIFSFKSKLDLSFGEMTSLTFNSQWSKFFELNDWTSSQHFLKQFLSGAFIAIVMTGLDQDMIQKNRSIRTLAKSQKNMYWYGSSFIPLNFLFLVLGVLMLQFASQAGITLPERTDEYLPFFINRHYFGIFVSICFVVGVVAATFSSADSSLTALTTSFCVDIAEKETDTRLRKIMHIVFCVLLVILICAFKWASSKTLIDMIYTLVSYTYGPLLGLFAFGLFTHRNPINQAIPIIAIASPVICFFIDWSVSHFTNYRFGYELLMLNGAITFLALLISSFFRGSSVSSHNRN